MPAPFRWQIIDASRQQNIMCPAWHVYVQRPDTSIHLAGTGRVPEAPLCAMCKVDGAFVLMPINEVTALRPDLVKVADEEGAKAAAAAAQAADTDYKPAKGKKGKQGKVKQEQGAAAAASASAVATGAAAAAAADVGDASKPAMTTVSVRPACRAL